ncbi:MAG TPA: helix-turn-helix domain-containing protein [Microvirga sp.]|nr:helix-turn-helix domain-containing protein [Microvirga sp.]
MVSTSKNTSGDPMLADCPGREIFNHLTSRWGFLVLLALADGPLRFHALRDQVEGVSEKVLAETLRTLTRDGLITRSVKPTVPPQVTYALSELGREVAPLLGEIRSWLAWRVSDVLAAQWEFDRHREATQA